MNQTQAKLADRAPRIRRGVMRLMDSLGYASVGEFALGNGMRADVLGINGQGRIVIVEIKSGRADFLGDCKWQAYMEYCDRFYFAVEPGFPAEILPQDAGLIIADAHGGSVSREAPEALLNGNRRRSLILDLALTASRRLARLDDSEV